MRWLYTSLFAPLLVLAQDTTTSYASGSSSAATSTGSAPLTHTVSVAYVSNSLIVENHTDKIARQGLASHQTWFLQKLET